MIEDRRQCLKALTAIFLGGFVSSRGNAETSKTGSLTRVNFPKPRDLRGGWAALAAVLAARGWGKDVYAKKNEWLYHDGGGNWASLRFLSENRAVLLGHDHEYSKTYFGAAAEYFGEEETNLLDGAPEWWGSNLDPRPFGEWIGFIYGWDGSKWLRSSYVKPDGFTSLNLTSAFSQTDLGNLTSFSREAPGLKGQEPDPRKLKRLIAADARITEDMLDDAVPGWDSKAGARAARKFLRASI